MGLGQPLPDLGSLTHYLWRLNMLRRDSSRLSAYDVIKYSKRLLGKNLRPLVPQYIQQERAIDKLLADGSQTALKGLDAALKLNTLASPVLKSRIETILRGYHEATEKERQRAEEARMRTNLESALDQTRSDLIGQLNIKEAWAVDSLELARKADHELTEALQKISAMESAITDLSREKQDLIHENELLRSALDISGPGAYGAHTRNEYASSQSPRIGADEHGVICADALSEYLSPMIFTSTPLQILEATERLYPNSLLILDSAISSAKSSKKFELRKQLFEKLTKLALDFRDAKKLGLPDSVGIEIFGRGSFAARESEKIENSQRLKKFRTFRYAGKELYMPMHLKIGQKESIAKTLRIHFEWDQNIKKVVIGHCGEHLPLR